RVWKLHRVISKSNCMSGDPFVASRLRQRARLWLAASAALVGAAVVPGSVPASDAAASATSPICQAASPGGPLFITATCVDPELNRPYIDVKRPGTTTDSKTGIAVSYTYVHGGFTGTSTRFSFYF